MNSYLVCFNQDTISRDDFVDCIDSIPEIENWMTFFDNTVCIVSEQDAKEIFNTIHDKHPSAQFLISRLDRGTRAGWLRKSVWDFISRPKSVVS